MSKNLPIIIILVLLLSGALIFIFSNKYRDKEQISSSEAEQISASETSEFHEQSEYISTKYGFSFNYPQDFTVAEFGEGEDGDTIMVQKQGSKDAFQIFISPFDEPGPLTKERVLEDLPDMVIKNPEQRVLKNGAKALIFFSEEPSLGEIREIWFIYPVSGADSNGVHNGYLYQISTYKELDSLVAKILETWKFQE